MNRIASPIFKEDLNDIFNSNFICWEQLKNQTVLITGASGLIGSAITNSLLYISKKLELGIKIVVCVRDVTKAKNKIYIDGDVSFIETSIENLSDVPMDVNYIVHSANPTDSSFFVRKPVETIGTAVLGTRNILEIARKKNCKGVVYLSTMEVYGFPPKGSRIAETDVGSFDPTVVRNCYPLSKLLCESMVEAYAAEYSVPGKVVRLTQTFGPGVEYHDTRIFAEFARCAIENKDIVLYSNGKTERCYLYVADAVTAVIAVLLGGAPGEIFTAANSSTYCSIYDMAKMVAHEVAGDRIKVCFQIDGLDRGYADTLYMNLDTTKIEALGWRPKRDLREMFFRMIEDLNYR